MKMKNFLTFLFLAVIFFFVSIPLGLIIYFKRQLPSLWKKHMVIDNRKQEIEQQLMSAYKRVSGKARQETKLGEQKEDNVPEGFDSLCVHYPDKGGSCWN